MTTVLVLAGTAEARQLADRLARIDGIAPIASLAGATAAPRPLAIPVRTGGFGGAEGLGRWLRAHRPAVLIDATHPFARQMQENAARAAEQTRTPRCRLLRPPWPVRPGWRLAPDLDTAVGMIPAGARVLATTGQRTAALADRSDTEIVLRTIEPVADLPAHIRPLLDRPPFTVDSERALFALLGITHLLTKNAGGDGTAKLDAAEMLGIATIVVARPPVPPGPVATTVGEAVAWLMQTVAFAPPAAGRDESA